MTTKTSHQTCRRAAEMESSGASPLSEERLNELAEHVEHCEACRKWLEENAGLGGLGMLADDVRAAAKVRDETPMNVATPVDRLNELLQAEGGKGAGGKGGYRVEAEIGRGGMGVVYKAWQADLHRHVALKVLPALLCAVRPDAMARFRREAALAAGLKHSNIIGVYDFGEIGGTLYYAMELVEGRSLRDLIGEMRAAGGKGGMEGALAIVASATDQTPVPPASAVSSVSSVLAKSLTGRSRAAGSGGGQTYFRRVAGWIADVAEALHYAHEQGVIHRDIKPGNLMLSRAGRLMICDFGLARSVIAGVGEGGNDPRSLTMTRALIGTSRYMSPESVDETVGPVDRRSDVYALGATLYELLTLKPLFAAEDDREILNRVLSTEPVAPRTIVRQVPAELEIICLKALAKRPRERYESAQAFADDLRRWVLGMPILARRPSLVVRVRNFVRRRKAVSALTVVLAATVIVGGAFGAKAWKESARAERTAADLKLSRITALTTQAAAAASEGRYSDALAATEQGLAIDPDNLVLARERGHFLDFLNHRPEAAAALEAFCLKHPDDARAHYYLTRVYVLWDKAPPGKLKEHVDQVVRLAPDSSDAFYARSLLEKDAQAAVALLTKSLELQPNRPEVLLGRAFQYGRLKEFQSQLDDLDRCSARVPEGLGALQQRGQALQGLHREAEAEEVFSRAIAEDSTSASAWRGRAMVRSKLGKHDEAIKDATQAIELDSPAVAEAYLTRAWAYLSAGRLQEAKADFDKVIDIDPRNDDVYLNRSIVLSRLDRWEDALADTDRAIELRHDSIKARNNRVTCLFNLNRYAEAIPDIDELIRLEPGNAGRHRVRAILTQKLDRLEETEASLSKAIALEGRNAGDFQSRGWLRIALGTPQTAIADFTRSIELDTAKSNCHTGRAYAYVMLGQWDLAIQDLKAQPDAVGTTADQVALFEYFVLAEAGRPRNAAAKLRSAIPLANDKFTTIAMQAAAGEVDETQLSAAAAGPTEQTFASYYAAMIKLVAGDREGAAQRFAQCIKKDTEGTDVAYVARGRLKLMEQAGGK